MANEEAISFVNVKLTLTPSSGTAVSTQCIFSLEGLGSKRDPKKKKCLNNKVMVTMSSKEYDALNFSLPYSETANAFHEVATAQYDTNKSFSLEIEFDNKKTTAGKGTTIKGTALFSSYAPKNDDEMLVSDFSCEWSGEPTLTKAK